MGQKVWEKNLIKQGKATGLKTEITGSKPKLLSSQMRKIKTGTDQKWGIQRYEPSFEDHQRVERSKYNEYKASRFKKKEHKW